MTSPSKHGALQDIGVGTDLLDLLGADALTALIGLGADIVALVDEKGVVNRLHYRNADLDAYGLSAIVGKPLRDCVTVESVPKIDALLAPAKKRPPRGYQVNHSASGHPDLPVAYTASRTDDFPFTIVVGHEMRQQMLDQQRLVEAQIAMEADYRELRQAEARYRTVFKMSETAHVVLDGEKRTILEANTAAVSLLTGASGNLTGKAIRDLFKKGDRERLADAIGEARHSGEPVQLANLQSSAGSTFDAKLRAYREHGTTNLVITLENSKEPDRVDAKRSSDQLNGARVDLELLPEAALTIDGEGTVLSANTLFLDRVHAPTLNQVVGRNVSNWLGKSTVELSVLFTRVRDEKTLSGFSSVLTDTLGEGQDVSLSAHYNKETDTTQLLVIPPAASAGKMTLPPPATPDQAEGFASLVGKVPLKELIRESLDVVERICIEAALDQTNNNRASAAEILGLSRQSLYIKLRRHGLENYRPGN